MLEKKYADIMTVRLPAARITTKTINFIIEHPMIHRGSVRIFHGLIYTDKQYKRFQKVLAKKLP